MAMEGAGCTSRRRTSNRSSRRAAAVFWPRRSRTCASETMAAARAAEGGPDEPGETAGDGPDTLPTPASASTPAAAFAPPAAVPDLAPATGDPAEIAESADGAPGDRIPMEERRALVHARALEAIAAMKAAEQ